MVEGLDLVGRATEPEGARDLHAVGSSGLETCMDSKTEGSSQIVDGLILWTRRHG